MTKLAFLDIETTGLDPFEDTILELGIVIYDVETREAVANRNWVFKAPFPDAGTYPEIVMEMHHKNGLWNECAESPDNFIGDEGIEEEVRYFLEMHDALNTPMCGNTISFDRSFLSAQAEGINALFHYRSIDVSTLNCIAQYIPGTLVKAPKGDAHRSIPDCESSIAQFNHYLSQMLSDEEW